MRGGNYPPGAEPRNHEGRDGSLTHLHLWQVDFKLTLEFCSKGLSFLKKKKRKRGKDFELSFLKPELAGCDEMRFGGELASEAVLKRDLPYLPQPHGAQVPLCADSFPSGNSGSSIH